MQIPVQVIQAKHRDTKAAVPQSMPAVTKRASFRVDELVSFCTLKNTTIAGSWRLKIALGSRAGVPDHISKAAFSIASGIALFGAIIHWIAPFIGYDWYAFLGAPTWVLESVREQSLAAPAGAAAIGGLMATCALYSLSGAAVIPRLPLLRLGIVTIALICLARGLVLLPYLLLVPGTFTPFNVIGSAIWLIAGLGFATGGVRRWRQLR
jgi:hypothetical protein